jgi:hypothetical protein
MLECTHLYRLPAFEIALSSRMLGTRNDIRNNLMKDLCSRYSPEFIEYLIILTTLTNFVLFSITGTNQIIIKHQITI